MLRDRYKRVHPGLYLWSFSCQVFQELVGKIHSWPESEQGDPDWYCLQEHLLLIDGLNSEIVVGIHSGQMILIRLLMLWTCLLNQQQVMS